MKKIGAIVVAIMALSAIVPMANAADTGDVSVTVTVSGVLGIVVYPTSWAIGTIAEGGYDNTTGTTYYVNNTGNENEDLEAKVTDPANWNIGASPGNEIFKMCADGSGNGGSNVTLTTGYLDVFTGITAETSKTYEIHFWAPTNTAYGGTQQTITLNWKATAS